LSHFIPLPLIGSSPLGPNLPNDGIHVPHGSICAIAEKCNSFELELLFIRKVLPSSRIAAFLIREEVSILSIYDTKIFRGGEVLWILIDEFMQQGSCF
jgi:hypothetical protein